MGMLQNACLNMHMKRAFLTIKLGLAFFIFAILLHLSYAIITKFVTVGRNTQQ